MGLKTRGVVFIVSGESWTQNIFTSDSGNKWFIFLYRAPVCSAPGSVFKAFTHCSSTHITLTHSVCSFPSLNTCITCVTGLGHELDELMVEGFLLQVTLPETEQLYRYLLYKLAPPPSHSSPSGKHTDQDQQSQRGSPHHNKVTIKTKIIDSGAHSR